MRLLQTFRHACLSLALMGFGTLLSSTPAVAGDWGHPHRMALAGYGGAYLPRTSLVFGVGGAPWIDRSGWHRRSGPRYIVSPPTVGLILPGLPPGSTTVYVGGVPYYYAQGVYYGAVTGGYAVVPTPPLPPIVEVQMPASAPVAPNATTSSAPPVDGLASGIPPLPASDWILYPRNGQSAVQTQADRQECNQWASTQNQANLASVYQRALLACLEAKGYTVR